MHGAAEYQRQGSQAIKGKARMCDGYIRHFQKRHQTVVHSH